MSKKHPQSIEEKIHSTLNACIDKMADHLRNTFNPKEKESLSLFRQFCSALKTRMQWIKDSAKTFEELKAIVQRANKTGQKAQTGQNSQAPAQNRLEQLLKTKNSNNPLRPKDLNNGLVTAS